MNKIILFISLIIITNVLCDEYECDNYSQQFVRKIIKRDDIEIDIKSKVYEHVSGFDGTEYKLFNRTTCKNCIGKNNTHLCNLDITNISNFNNKVCYGIDYGVYAATEIRIDELNKDLITNFCSENYIYIIHLLNNILLDRNVNFNNNSEYIQKIYDLYPTEFILKSYNRVDFSKLLCSVTFVALSDEAVFNRKLLKNNLIESGTNKFNLLMKSTNFENKITEYNNVQLLLSLGYIHIQNNVIDKLKTVVSNLDKYCITNKNQKKCLSHMYFTGSIIYSIPRVYKVEEFNKIKEIVQIVDDIISNYVSYLKTSNLLNKTEDYTVLKDNLNNDVPYLLEVGIKNLICTYPNEFKDIFNKLDKFNPLKLITFQCMIDSIKREELRDITHNGMLINDYIMWLLAPNKIIRIFSYKTVKINITLSSYYSSGEINSFVNLLEGTILNILKLINKNELSFDIEIRGILMKGAKNNIKFGFRDLLGIYIPSKNEFVVFNFVMNNGVITYESLETVIHEITHNIVSEVMPMSNRYPSQIHEGIAHFITNMILHGVHGLAKYLQLALNYNYSEYDPVRQLTIHPTSNVEFYRDVNILSTIYIYFLYNCNLDNYYKFLFAVEHGSLSKFLESFYDNGMKTMFVNFISNSLERYPTAMTNVMNDIKHLEVPLEKLKERMYKDTNPKYC